MIKRDMQCGDYRMRARYTRVHHDPIIMHGPMSRSCSLSSRIYSLPFSLDNSLSHSSSWQSNDFLIKCFHGQFAGYKLWAISAMQFT